MKADSNAAKEQGTPRRVSSRSISRQRRAVVEGDREHARHSRAKNIEITAELGSNDTTGNQGRGSYTPTLMRTVVTTRSKSSCKIPKETGSKNVDLIDLTDVNVTHERVAKVAPTQPLPLLPCAQGKDVNQAAGECQNIPNSGEIMPPPPASQPPLVGTSSAMDESIASSQPVPPPDPTPVASVAPTGKSLKRKSETMTGLIPDIKTEVDEDMSGDEIALRFLGTFFTAAPSYYEAIVSKIEKLEEDLKNEKEKRQNDVSDLTKKMETEREKAAKVKKELREKYGQSKAFIIKLTAEKEELSKENKRFRAYFTPILQDEALVQLCGGRRENETLTANTTPSTPSNNSEANTTI